MSNWQIKDYSNDRYIDVESRKEGEDKLEDFEGELELELLAPDGRSITTNFEDDTEEVDPEIVDMTEKTDGGTTVEQPPKDPGTPAAEQADPRNNTMVEKIDETQDGQSDTTKPEVVETTEQPPENVSNPEPAPINLDDPESHLPGWMLTEIDHGNNTGIDLSKNGTQVVAGALGLEVNAECEVSAEETDYEYCRYRATVKKPNGMTFNAVGDCHIDESGKDKWDLERMAETRAKKRCVKWASSGGIEALEKVRQ